MYLREDWEGVDCQVYFNDPEDMESQSSDEARQLLYESEFEWLDEELRVAASRSIFLQGPTCMSTMKYSQSDDSDSGADDSSDEAQELAPGLWLCDTGSGHDLTTPAGAGDNEMQNVRRIVFSTAHGRISTDRALNLISKVLRGAATPYILPETRWVLSIGKRVMEMGYSFVSVAKTAPWLISPDGHRIDLEVHGNIPFLLLLQGSLKTRLLQEMQDEGDTRYILLRSL